MRWTFSDCYFGYESFSECLLLLFFCIIFLLIVCNFYVYFVDCLCTLCKTKFLIGFWNRLKIFNNTRYSEYKSKFPITILGIWISYFSYPCLPHSFYFLPHLVEPVASSSLACGRLHPTLLQCYSLSVSCVSVSKCLPYKDTGHNRFKAHPKPVCCPLNYICNALVPISN